jgi:hypothetical protein
MRGGICFVILLLGGCSRLVGVDPDADYQVLVAAVVQQCDTSPASSASPSTAMEVGFVKVQAACEGFFVEATRAQQNALAAKQGLDAALVGATAIINPTNSVAAALKAVTITTAGVVLTKALIDEYNSVYAFGPYLYKVREHVQNSMEKYMSDSRASPPTNYCLAYTYVQKLAMLCSLAAMKADLDQQVALPSTISNAPPTGGTSPLRPALAPKLSARPLGISGAGGVPPPINYTVRPLPVSQ